MTPHVPRISGMAALYRGFLTFKKNDKHILSLRHPELPSWVAELDGKMLRGSLQQALIYDTLLVVGHNTFVDMKRMLENAVKRTEVPSNVHALVADEKGYTLYQYEENEVDGSGAFEATETHLYRYDDTLFSLRHVAICHAIHHQMDVVVLGGKSVYGSFTGDYDTFYLCEISHGELAQEESDVTDGINMKALRGAILTRSHSAKIIFSHTGPITPSERDGEKLVYTVTKIY